MLLAGALTLEEQVKDTKKVDANKKYKRDELRAMLETSKADNNVLEASLTKILKEYSELEAKYSLLEEKYKINIKQYERCKKELEAARKSLQLKDDFEDNSDDD